MSLQVEKLEKNMAKLTIEVSAEELEKAIEGAYQKNKNKISIPGFRKGKAPRKMIEQMYGKSVFYEDAANALIPDAYDKALEECEEQIVSSPKIDVTQLEAGKPFIFTAEVALKPEVTLGKYKGVKVDKIEVKVTDEEVDAEINRERESNARTINVEDRAVKDGDMTVIDFEGFVDGVAFEGGSVTAGMAIYDTMKYIKCDVSTVCIGMAASMGAFLLAGGAKGKRFALPNAEIMIHQPLGGTQGQATEIEIAAKHILRTKEKLNRMLAENTGKDYETICADTERDNWKSAEEACEYGLIDKVITFHEA